MPLLAWPLISVGWEGSWLLSMCSFPHVPSSWPIPTVAQALRFPPQVALAAGSPWPGYLSASAARVVCLAGSHG